MIFLSRRVPIFYNALLLTCVNLTLRLVSTSFQVHISARIGPSGVGLLQLVLSVGALALTAGMGGIRTTAMYLTAEEMGKKRPGNVIWVLSGCFAYGIACSGAVAAILYFAAPVIARDWIGHPETVTAIRLYGLFLPIVVLSGCMSGYFTAANRIGMLAAVEIAEQLCYMAVTMTALQLWAGNDPVLACEAVVLGSGVSACITLTVLVILRLRERSCRAKQIPVASRLLAAAVPLAVADVAKAGISTTENLMVPKRLSLFPGELTPLATFGLVCGMVFPVMMFPAAILFALAELLIPELARCNAAGSRKRIRYLVKRGLKIAALYGSACCGILYLLAEPLCLRLYGDTAAASYLRQYSLLVPMLYCDAITDAMTKGLGQQKTCVRYNIITSAMDVALLFLLLPRFGMAGYFFSFLMTHAINFLLSLRRLLGIACVKIPFSLPVLTVSGVAAGVLAATRISNPAGRVVAFGVVAGCLLYLFRVVSREDLSWLRGLVRRK